jgi:hypothetical protein
MKAVVARASRVVPLTLEEVDISADAELERLYGVDIPVLIVDGKKVAKHRIAEDALLRVLRARQTGGDAEGPG